MITETMLREAVAKGLVSAGQAEALRSLARQDGASLPAEPQDEERLRFVTGFADIFVTLGLVLFLGSTTYLVGSLSPPPAFVFGVTAALSWGLAEFFTRRRRMALPSILLLLVFVQSAFLTIGLLVGVGTDGSFLSLGWFTPAWRPQGSPPLVALAAIGAAALAALHYWRFRVPITIAAGVAALALCALMIVFGLAPEFSQRFLTGLLLTLGLVIFALAMRFDLSDPSRLTRRTDIAFWLHLLASPLIVHSVFQGIGAGRGEIAPGMAALVLLIFAGLAVVALLVDRRAMLVSGLVYAGVAFGSLISQAGLTNLSVPYTLLALGALVLLLSAGWAPLRSRMLQALPWAWSSRLPLHAAR